MIDVTVYWKEKEKKRTKKFISTEYKLFMLFEMLENKYLRNRRE